MGYDLYITRRKDWSESGHDITAEEWLAYVDKDPELSLSPENGPYFAKWGGKSKYPAPLLDWFGGNIYTKNPDAALIDKMVTVAQALRAKVQGEEGEIYQSGSEPPIHSQPSPLERFRNWLRALRPVRPLKPVEPPYQVGDRVVNPFHKEATVIELDPKSNHGLGKVKIRYDDGLEASFTLVASGLSPVQHIGRRT